MNELAWPIWNRHRNTVRDGGTLTSRHLVRKQVMTLGALGVIASNLTVVTPWPNHPSRDFISSSEILDGMGGRAVGSKRQVVALAKTRAPNGIEEVEAKRAKLGLAVGRA
nr:hypothetical protein Iba_chr13cCG15680 [Ipomoea batatas]